MHRERFVIIPVSGNLHFLKSVHGDANDRSLSCEYSKGRRAIRRLIKELYSLLKKLGLKLADQKTFIGRTAKGFNFLGYRISPKGITMAQSTLDKMVTRYRRRYAKGASQATLTAYLKRWIQWAKSGASLNVEKLYLTIQSVLTNSCNVARS